MVSISCLTGFTASWCLSSLFLARITTGRGQFDRNRFVRGIRFFFFFYISKLGTAHRLDETQREMVVKVSLFIVIQRCKVGTPLTFTTTFPSISLFRSLEGKNRTRGRSLKVSSCRIRRSVTTSVYAGRKILVSRR